MNVFGQFDPKDVSVIVDGRLPELVHDIAALPATQALPAVPFRIGAHLSPPNLRRRAARPLDWNLT